MSKEEVEIELEKLKISWIELQKFVLVRNDFTVRFNPELLWEQSVNKILKTGEFPVEKPKK